MTDDQSDAFKKAMRDVTDVVDAKLAEKQQIAIARWIAAEVRRNSEISGTDKRFLKGLRISPW